MLYILNVIFLFLGFSFRDAKEYTFKFTYLKKNAQGCSALWYHEGLLTESVHLKYILPHRFGRILKWLRLKVIIGIK